MEAILYARWSSLEQTRGTSAARQHELTEAFAEREGWRVAERVSDEGVSAWTGDNIQSGNLAKLIAQLERTGGAGKALVVEKLDRLSRRPALEMAGWISRATATGLTIATVDGRHRIDAQRLARDQMAVLAFVFDAFRGNDESQVKSDRVSEAWKQKRERGAPMSRRCPAWLEPIGSTSIRSDQSDSRYRAINERAALVRWMFEQSRDGMPTGRIARILNERDEPVWGRGDGWNESYIKKILTNAAVVGEYQPHTKPKGSKRLPAGEPIRDYFPAVVPLELYQAVNDKRAHRVRREQSGHNRLGNLLAGLARCAECGATMTYLDKGAETLAAGGTVARRYLKCSRVHRSVGECGNRRSFNYTMTTDTILDELLHRAMDDQHFARSDSVAGLETECAGHQRDLDDAHRRQSAALRMVEDDPEDELASQRYRQHRDAGKAAKAALTSAKKALIEARGKVSPAEHLRRVAEVRAMLESADEDERYQARSRVKLALNDLVESIQFNGSRNGASVFLRHGLGLLIIRDDGETLFWNLHKPGVIERDATDEDRALIAAYERRCAA